LDPYGIDQNGIITDLIKDFSANVFDHAKKLTASQIKKLKTTFKIGFDDYLNQQLRTASLVKTLLYRDRPENISNIYVDQEFVSGGERYTEAQVLAKIEANAKLIVSGQAGSGKSFFVKNLVYTLAAKKEKFPIFVELRHAAESPSILQYIITELFRIHLPEFDKDDLDYALKSGLFVLVLDGIDEVPSARKDSFLKEIEFITERFSNCSLVVTTRPEEEVLNFPTLPIYHVQPMALGAASELVQALAFDEEVKREFLTALEESIYDDHTDFASNPLLLTMLLLTFDQVGEIQDKMHIFYNQAFEALVFKHDLMKSRYRRVRKAPMEVHVLKRTFAYFCAKTYISGALSFDDTSILEELQEAVSFAMVSVDPADFRDDLILNYSMLKRDGLQITFVHRSFQEYFCSVHLSSAKMNDRPAAIKQVAARGEGEQVLRLLYDIAPEMLASEWLLSELEKAKSDVDSCLKNQDFSTFIKSYFQYVQILGKHFEQPRSNGEPAARSTSYSLQVGRTSSWRILRAINGLAVHHGKYAIDIAFPLMMTEEIPEDARRELSQAFSSVSNVTGTKFEPTPEDNKWLAHTWLAGEMTTLQAWLVSAIEHFQSIAEPRFDLSGHRGPNSADSDVQPKSKQLSDRRTVRNPKTGQMQDVHWNVTRKVFE
jgi:hypothetical protein